MFVRIFWRRVTFKLVEWIKHMTFPNLGGPHPNSWRSELKKKADTPLSKEGKRTPTWLPLSWDRNFFFSYLPNSKWNTNSSWVSTLLVFRLELHYQLSWFSGLWTWTETTHTPSAHLPGSPACQGQILELSSLLNHISQFLILNPSVFPENLNKYTWLSLKSNWEGFMKLHGQGYRYKEEWRIKVNSAIYQVAKK